MVNEDNEILLLKQNYITIEKWTVVTGYTVDGKLMENKFFDDMYYNIN